MIHSTEDQQVHTSQIFLPYYNSGHTCPSSTETDLVEGWQFGLPPLPDLDANLYIVILGRGGDLYHCKDPSIKNETNRPPEPLWAWAPVETQHGRVRARIVPPNRQPGSVPLEDLKQMGRERFYTPSGLEDEGLPQEPCDLTVDVLGAQMDGHFDLTLGAHDLGTARAENGELKWIEPSRQATEYLLWTSHLARVFETLLHRGEPL